MPVTMVCRCIFCHQLVREKKHFIRKSHGNLEIYNFGEPYFCNCYVKLYAIDVCILTVPCWPLRITG